MDGGAWGATVPGVAKSPTRLKNSSMQEGDGYTFCVCVCLCVYVCYSIWLKYIFLLVIFSESSQYLQI